MRLIHEYELESRDSNHTLIQKIDLFLWTQIFSIFLNCLLKRQPSSR